MNIERNKITKKSKITFITKSTIKAKAKAKAKAKVKKTLSKRSKTQIELEVEAQTERTNTKRTTKILNQYGKDFKDLQSFMTTQFLEVINCDY